MPNTPPNLMAGGNIYPSRFVMLDSSNGFKCVQATASPVNKLIGISQEGTDYPPINDTDHITVAGYAAVSGEGIRIYGDGDCCLLEIVSGQTITPGQFLIPDSNGKGTAVGTGATTQHVGAVALQATTATSIAGEKIMVQVKVTPYTYVG